MSNGNYNRPRIGDPTVLVYRECMCGEWCATGEGARAPICPNCARRMMPLGTAAMDDGGPMFGADRNEQRRLRGLGFLGVLTNEISAAEQVGRLRGLLGLAAASAAHGSNGAAQYGAEREIERTLIHQELPTDTPPRIVRHALGMPEDGQP